MISHVPARAGCLTPFKAVRGDFFCRRQWRYSGSPRRRRLPEPAEGEDTHSTALAFNDRLLLHLPEQFVDGLTRERKHHAEPLLRHAHTMWRLGLSLTIAFEQVDQTARQPDPGRFQRHILEQRERHPKLSHEQSSQMPPDAWIAGEDSRQVTERQV